MREIKVRAWDKRARKWRVVTSLVWYKPDTGKAGVCGAVIVTDTNHDQFMPIEDIELVEFTGLKDKNGVEIYEGDILRSIENDNVYLVEQFVPIQRTDNLTRLGVYIDGKYHKVPEDMVLGDDWKSWPEMYEVIGNIYENPELLDKAA